MRKSRCCAAVVWRFGKRRRRCSSCRRTWRIRVKRRGRPRLRYDGRLVEKIFVHRRSLTELAAARGLTRQALSYRFLRTLEGRLTRDQDPQPINSDDLVLLVDGLWFRFKRRPWVLYLMAFKRPDEDKAVFIDPILQEGGESRTTWKRAFETIPSNRRTKIRALVCDAFAGCTSLAKWNGWVLQLCQFHLLAGLYQRLGKQHRYSVGARELRQKGYQLVRNALTTNSADQLRDVLEELKVMADESAMPWKFGNILRTFARRLQYYRAYQEHPHLRLPRTTSSMESKGAAIRDVMRRSKNITTPASLVRWVTNYLRVKPEIACRAA